MNGEGGCDPLFIGGGRAGATSAIHVTSIKHHWIKLPLNQGLRSLECMEVCTKAMGERWTSIDTIGASIDPPMIGGTHLPLLEGWPTVIVCDWPPLSRWMLHCGPMNPCDFIFHPWEKTQVWFKSGNCLQGTSHGFYHLGRAWWAHRGVGQPLYGGSIG